MPTYIATSHAIDRVIERFPALLTQRQPGETAGSLLARLAGTGRPVGRQIGLDILIQAVVDSADGTIDIYLPVVPHGKGDTWAIRTVLTGAQARSNVAAIQRYEQDRWHGSRGRRWARREHAAAA